MRLRRFVLTFTAVLWGLVGLAAVLLCLTGLLTSIKSFGVPYFAPMAPKTVGANDVIVREQVYNPQAETLSGGGDSEGQGKKKSTVMTIKAPSLRRGIFWIRLSLGLSVNPITW